jgi:inward rectifier potassium channel
MALSKHFNKQAKIENETGLGTNSNLNAGRFFNKDGKANIQVGGMGFLERINWFYALLNMPRWKFTLLVLLFFIVTNFIFALVYLAIGIEHLGGMVATTHAEKIGEAFFFSAQTFTTVGYGRINPIGFAASVTAAFEALCGLMSFALATGLLYGRFAKPKAFIRYSKNAIFAPFGDGTALMFRMVPFTKNHLVNVEAKVTVAMRIMEDGQIKNRFYNAALDIAKANALTANWNLVHAINEDSPLYNLTKEDIENASLEIISFVQGFDESFSNTVVSRTSYTADELVYGAKFLPMYGPTADGKSTILHLDKLDDYEPAKISIEF